MTTRHRRPRTLRPTPGRALALALLAALLAGACSDDGPSAVTVTDAWARSTAPTADTGAVYLELHGGDEVDTVVGVRVEPAVAAGAELHHTTTDESMDGTSGGAMSMVPIEGVNLRPGDTVTFGPGGAHVMLVDLVAPLVAGETFELTFDLQVGDDVVVEVEVRDG